MNVNDDNTLPLSQTIERFIPISKQEIISDLSNASCWNAESGKRFELFCAIFIAMYHFKFHAHFEELKRCYAPFNPDADISSIRKYSDSDKKTLHDKLLNEMKELLNNANYEYLTKESIDRAMSEASPYGLEVSVDLSEYDDLVIYYRGSSSKIIEKRDWRKLFLTKYSVEVPTYQRIFLLLKFKDEKTRISELTSQDAKLTEEKAQKKVQKARSVLPEFVNQDSVFIKLFKNIPRADIEMLFPNQQVRLKLFDKIKLGITGGGGTVGGVITAISKLAVALNPFTIVTAFVGLAIIIFRQVNNILNQRTKYMMTLSKNLYFHNLDNNQGVINYLVDMAEEEECKEALLAYYFLLTQADQHHTQASLDKVIEQYLSEKYQVKVDFEVEDGLHKLREEDLLIEREGKLSVVDLQTACKRLDKKWDEFFQPTHTTS